MYLSFSLPPALGNTHPPPLLPQIPTLFRPCSASVPTYTNPPLPRFITSSGLSSPYLSTIPHNSSNTHTTYLGLSEQQLTQPSSEQHHNHHPPGPAPKNHPGRQPAPGQHTPTPSTFYPQSRRACPRALAPNPATAPPRPPPRPPPPPTPAPPTPWTSASPSPPSASSAACAAQRCRRPPPQTTPPPAAWFASARASTTASGAPSRWGIREGQGPGGGRRAAPFSFTFWTGAELCSTPVSEVHDLLFGGYTAGSRRLENGPASTGSPRLRRAAYVDRGRGAPREHGAKRAYAARKRPLASPVRGETLPRRCNRRETGPLPATYRRGTTELAATARAISSGRR